MCVQEREWESYVRCFENKNFPSIFSFALLFSVIPIVTDAESIKTTREAVKFFFSLHFSLPHATRSLTSYFVCHADE